MIGWRGHRGEVASLRTRCASCLGNARGFEDPARRRCRTDDGRGHLAPDRSGGSIDQEKRGQDIYYARRIDGRGGGGKVRAEGANVWILKVSPYPVFTWGDGGGTCFHRSSNRGVENRRRTRATTNAGGVGPILRRGDVIVGAEYHVFFKYVRRLGER